MTPSPCQHPQEAARVPIHGTRLLLCSLCWETIDPEDNALARHSSSRSHTFEPVEAVVPSPLPSASEPVPVLTPSSSAAAARRGPSDDFRDLRPSHRHDRRFLRGFGQLLVLLIGIAVVIYGAMLGLLEYPSFSEFLSPDETFSLEFPARPISVLSDARQVTLDLEALRDSFWARESYRIRVSTAMVSRQSELQLSRMLLIQDFDGANTLRLTEYLNRRNPDFIRIRTDVLGVEAAAEYIIWKPMRKVKVGRAAIAGGLIYDMTVSDGSLSLDDARVQYFFNSLRIR